MPMNTNAFSRFLAARRAMMQTRGVDAARDEVVSSRYDRLVTYGAPAVSRASARYPLDEIVTLFSDEQPAATSFTARELTDAMPQMVWSTRADGFHDYFNLQWYAFTGLPLGATDGDSWNGVFHPDDRERAWSAWRHSLATGDPYEIEYRLSHRDGGYRWTLGRALPIRCADGLIARWIGTCTDINDRKLGEEQRELLVQEMAHRIKNLFSIVSALISLGVRDAATAADLATTVQSKIVALAAAHSLVSNPNPDFADTRQTSLHAMLTKIVEPYQNTGAERISILGDDHPVGSQGATALALIFQELTTNSVKYGALSAPEGHLTLTIKIVADQIQVEWRELGGPIIEQAPTGHGFGTRLTEVTLAKQLNGSMERRWEHDGLLVLARIDRTKLSRDAV